MKEMFIISKTRLIFFLFQWILSIRSVTTSCDMQIPHGHVTWWCKPDDEPCPYSCNEGYKEHDAVPWLRCLSSGRWVPLQLNYFYFPVADFSVEDLCTPKPCSTVISKGTLSEGCKAIVGSTCNFSCEVGYVRNTSVSELTCHTSTEWSPDVGSLCLRPDGQQCPYGVARGYLNHSCIREPGHSCSFACNEGYHTFVSPPIITCGSNLRWDYDLPTLCQEIICPSVIQDGYISSNCVGRYKATCFNYECNHGYSASVGVSFLSCDESGKWVGPDGTSFACTEIICPSVIEGGYVSNNCSRRYKAICNEYRCNPGYTRSDLASYLTCDRSGQWVVPEGTPQACANATIYTLRKSNVLRSDLSMIGIVVGCVIGTILITVIVGLIIQGLRNSQKRRFFGHASSRCIGQSIYPERQVNSIVHYHNENNTGVAALSESYENSLESRINTISRKYSEPPPSYSQIDVISKEYPPTYEQVVANPSGF